MVISAEVYYQQEVIFLSLDICPKTFRTLRDMHLYQSFCYECTFNFFFMPTQIHYLICQKAHKKSETEHIPNYKLIGHLVLPV